MDFFKSATAESSQKEILFISIKGEIIINLFFKTTGIIQNVFQGDKKKKQKKIHVIMLLYEQN